MLHEEKKHFHSNSQPVNSSGTLPIAASKVSPLWTKDDVASLKKGIVSNLFYIIPTNELKASYML